MAFIEAVRNGFTSRSKVAAELGGELEDIDFENARDLSRAKELKLHYPVYPSLTDGTIPTGPETLASLKLQDRGHGTEVPHQDAGRPASRVRLPRSGIRLRPRGCLP